MVKFKNARYITGVAKEIRKHSEINDAAIKKCYNLYKAYVYLWHQNDPDKFQYDPEQVVGLTTSTHLNRTRVSPRKNR